MSLVQISGNASGTGTLTIAAPNTNSSYTLTLPTQTGTLVSGTTTAGVVAPAGTATLASILLTSGTNLTTATAGAVEYDGKVVYATPLGTQRGIVPTQQYYRLDSALVGANVNTAQSMFGVGVTLSASTVYEFEIEVALIKTVGATAHSVGIGFGGTATINNFIAIYNGGLSSSASKIDTTTSQVLLQAVTNTTASQSAGVASLYFWGVIKGTVSINAGGTFIPQYTLSAAPGGAYSTQIGSFIRIAPVSASGSNTSVGAWA